MPTTEAKFERDFCKRLEEEFPGCFIQKNDASRTQGVPDRLVLYRDRWAMLEFKRSRSSSQQANQEYYCEQFNDMSYAAFVHPGNAEEVIRELQQAFGVRGKARVS